MTFEYFYGNEGEQFTFYRIPKILFKDKRFKSISTVAKVLLWSDAGSYEPVC